jgi:hypothetical protein
MTWRSASPRYVRGSSRAIDCSTSPIVAIGKKIPDRKSIGSWTT